jgi:hypothetical protein
MVVNATVMKQGWNLMAGGQKSKTKKRGDDAHTSSEIRFATKVVRSVKQKNHYRRCLWQT